MIFNILEFGAKQIEGYNNNKHIQSAIDKCHLSGGGQVLVPPGVFFTSSIILKSNVDLHLEKGSVLMASKNIGDYTTFGELASRLLDLDEVPTWENCEYTGRPSQFFIYAKDCSHVKISGEGIIDGSEEIYYGNQVPGFIEGFYYPRIPLLFLEHVIDLEIKEVTLQRSGFWTAHLVGCEDVYIHDMKILNNLELANCDGIDPDHCKRMKIENCYIEAADDAIVFKNTEAANHYGACEYIEVKDCTLVTTSAGIKFGTESEADFKHISVKNISIKKASRGISFQLRDQGNIEDISFENINIQNERHQPGLWWGTGEPIFISAVKRHEDTKLGSIKDITFKNVRMETENGIVIYGEDKNISNITFKKIVLNLKNISDFNKEKIDLRPTIGSGILESKSYVIYIKDATDVKFKQFVVSADDTFKKLIDEPYRIENSRDIKLP